MRSNLNSELILQAKKIATSLDCLNEFENSLANFRPDLMDVGNFFTKLLEELKRAWDERSHFNRHNHKASSVDKDRLLQEFQNWYYRETQSSDSVNTEEKPLFFQVFEKTAEEKPNKVAVIFGEIEWTYAQLNQKANSIAHYLRRLIDNKALSENAIIALFFENSPEVIACILGVMKAGLAYVPLTRDPKLPLKRLAYCVGNSGAELLLVQEDLRYHDFVHFLQKENKLSICTFQEASQNEVGENLRIPVSKNQLAYITFSSGSTGIPKGIKIAHRGLMNPVKDIAEAFKITENDKIGWYSLLTFDAYLLDIMTALGNAATLVIIPQAIRSDASQLTTYLAAHDVSIITLVPSVLVILDPKKLPELRGFISTGEAAKLGLFAAWRKAGRGHNPDRIEVNGYGPSECTIAASLGYFSEDLNVGENPIQGLSWHVLSLPNENDPYPRNPKKVEEGEGELYLAGEGLALGYLEINGDKPDYHKRFRAIPHPDAKNPGEMLWIYQTGDVVERSNGKMLIVRRVDEQHKYLGELIHPGAIENALLEFENQECIQNSKVLIEVPDEAGNGLPILRAYVQLKGKVEAKENIFRKIQADLRHHSYVNITPSRFTLVNEWPTNLSGKLDLAQLKLTKGETYYSNPIFRLQAENASEIIKKMVLEINDIWHEILNIPKDTLTLCLEHNFYELGGDSIRVWRMHEAIKDKYGFHLNIRQFNACPTVRGLAFRILNSRGKTPFLHKIIKFKPIQALNPDKPPIILINSVTGDGGGDYQNLMPGITKNLDGWPVFYTEALSQENSAYIVQNLEELASDYITSLFSEKIFENYSGPIILLGYSAGGMLSYEMARQMQLSGRQAAVCCLDTLNSFYYQKLSQNDYAKEIYNMMGHMQGLMSMQADKEIISLSLLQDFSKHEQLMAYAQAIMEKLSGAKPGVQEKFLKLYSSIYNLVQTQLDFVPQPAKWATLISFLETRDKSKNNDLAWEPSFISRKIDLTGKHIDVVKNKEWVDETLLPEIIKFCHTSRRQMRLDDLISSAKEKNATPMSLIDLDCGAKGKLKTCLKDSLKKGERILVIGSKGSGKTSACQWIGNMWANGDLKDFDLVCRFDLKRDNPQASLDKLGQLEKILDMTTIASKNTVDSLGKILLIFDAYEALSAKDDLAQYIKIIAQDQSQKNNLVIIVTADSLSPDLSKINWNTRVELGFSAQNREDYSKAFITPQKSSEAFLECFKEKTELLELVRTPLHLSLVCEYWKGLTNPLEKAFNSLSCVEFMVEELWKRNFHGGKNEPPHSAFSDEDVVSAQQRIQNLIETLAAKAWPKKVLELDSVEVEISNWYKLKSNENIGDWRRENFLKELNNTGFIEFIKAEPGSKLQKISFSSSILVEYFTIQYLSKHLTLENRGLFSQFNNLIAKYPALYAPSQKIEENIYLKRLLMTSTIIAFSTSARERLLELADEPYLGGNIKESPIYQFVFSKIGEQGIKQIDAELKKIQKQVKFEVAVIRIYRHEPDHSFLKYFNEAENFFIGKKLVLSDPDGVQTRQAEILSCKKDRRSCWFDLEDDSKVKLEIDSFDRSISQVLISKKHEYNFWEYLKTHFDSSLVKEEKRCIDIKAISGSVLAEKLNEGRYWLSLSQNWKPAKEKKYRGLWSTEGFNRIFSLESDLTSSRFEIEIFQKSSLGSDKKIKLGSSTGSQDISISELMCCKVAVFTEFPIKGINAQNAKDKIKVKESYKDENKIKLEKFKKIDLLRNKVLLILKNHENRAYFDSLLEDLFRNQIQFLSQNVILNLEKSTAGFENLPILLEEIVSLQKQVGEEKTTSEILKKLVLEANYLNMINNKEKSSYVFKAMELLGNGFKHITSMKDKDLILFFGTTGSGKSAEAAFLLGAKMTFIQNEYFQNVLVIKPKDEHLVKEGKIPKIGQSWSSETTYVQGFDFAKVDRPVVEAENLEQDTRFEEALKSIVLCDCPGNKDTRGDDYDIATMISIDHTVINARAIKSIVLTIPFEAFFLDRAGPVLSLFLDLSERVPEIFTDQKIRSSIFLVVTKHNVYKDPIKIISEVVESKLKAEKEELEKNDQGEAQFDGMRRVVALELLSEMIENLRVQCHNIKDPFQRREMLKMLVLAPGIPKSAFAKALNQPHFQQQFGKHISLSLDTWKKGILKPYLFKLPELIAVQEKFIEGEKADLIKSKNDQKDIIRAMIDENMLIHRLKQKIIKCARFDQMDDVEKNEILVELKAINSDVQKEQIWIKKGQIEALEAYIREKEEKLKDLDLSTEFWREKGNVVQREKDKIPDEIKQLSDGVQKILLYKFKPKVNDTIKISTLKPNALQNAFDDFRPFKLDDFAKSGDEIIAGQYRGKLTHYVYLDKKFRILPSEKEEQERFLQYGESVGAIAYLRGANFRLDTSVHPSGKKPSEKGTKMIYVLKTDWSDPRIIPWVKISHILPKIFINEANIINLYTKSKTLEMDLEQYRKLEDQFLNEVENLSREIDGLRNSKKVLEEELDRIKNQIIQTGISALVEQCQKNIATYNWDIKNNRFIMQEKQKKSLENIEKIKAYAAILKSHRLQKRNFAIIIKTQFEILNLLKEFSNLAAIKDELGIEPHNRDKKLNKSCSNFVQYYNENIKNLQEECERDLNPDQNLEEDISFVDPDEESCKIIFKREELFRGEEQRIFFKLVPENLKLGKAKRKGDSFFDSCAESMNEILGQEVHTCKTMRVLCHDYVVSLDQQCGGISSHSANWVAQNFDEDTASYQGYFANVQYTAEERRAGEGIGDDRTPILGAINLDAHILSMKLGVRIHVIAVDQEEPCHYLIHKNELKTVNKEAIDWNDKGIIHIVDYESNFVPILKTSTLQKEGSYTLKIQKNREFSAKEGSKAGSEDQSQSLATFFGLFGTRKQEERSREKEEGSRKKEEAQPHGKDEKVVDQTSTEQTSSGKSSLPPAPKLNCASKILNEWGSDIRTLEGEVNISREEITPNLRNLDSYYSGDFVNILMQAHFHTPDIKLCPALTESEALNIDFLRQLLAQKANYVFIPLNVSFDRENSPETPNHWVALIINKRESQIFYLDPAGKMVSKDFKGELLGKLQLERGELLENTIELQQAERELRHCGPYMIEMFRLMAQKVIIEGRHISKPGDENPLFPESCSLLAILSEIPCGEVEEAHKFRKKHIEEAYQILFPQQEEEQEEKKTLNL